MTPEVIIYFDGLCEPRNPGGIGAWGWVAIDNGRRVADGCGFLPSAPSMTNNIAEYEAATQALLWARKHVAGRKVELRGDSMLVVNQLAGVWKCKAHHLRIRCEKLKPVIAELSCSLRWVPRERNTQADAMSRKGYAGIRAGR